MSTVLSLSITSVAEQSPPACIYIFAGLGVIGLGFSMTLVKIPKKREYIVQTQNIKAKL